MAAYHLVYDSRNLQADCQEPGSAPEPYARQSSMGYLFLQTHTQNTRQQLIHRALTRSWIDAAVARVLAVSRGISAAARRAASACPAPSRPCSLDLRPATTAQN